VAVQAVVAVSMTLLVLLLVRVGGATKTHAYVAAVPPVTVAMFVANRLWTFSDRL
jgi:putative flippase GtrA